jgi:DNA polymerase
MKNAAGELLKKHVKQHYEEGLIYFREDINERIVPDAVNIPKKKDANIPEKKVSNKIKLEKYKEEIKSCLLCGLGKKRKNFVFGEGNPDAKLVFVGEAPGADEDEAGKPFVGKAGQLLTKIIEAIKFKREEVFIANVLKCRPPANRPPAPEEIEKCKPYLLAQIELIGPKIICALGTYAAQTLLDTITPIGKLRGKIYERGGVIIIPTYHPSACFRNPAYKNEIWKDVKVVLKEYERICGSRG